MQHDTSAQCDKLLVPEVVLGVVRPPRTDFEIRITETITNMINGRETSEFCLVEASLGLGFEVAILEKQRPL